MIYVPNGIEGLVLVPRVRLNAPMLRKFVFRSEHGRWLWLALLSTVQYLLFIHICNVLEAVAPNAAFHKHDLGICSAMNGN
jgi:hypothetical protein